MIKSKRTNICYQNYLKIFKKEKLPLDYFYTTDLHSHLIPNIDDGVKTLEESVEIIKI